MSMIYYTNYPQSAELTEKSKKTARNTRLSFGMVYGILPGLICILVGGAGIPVLQTAGMVLAMIGIIVGPIVTTIYRKKKFAEYDAEYQRLLESMRR